MHCLISLSALHVAYLNPDDRRANLHIAAHHHTVALSGFRADIDTIGPHNAEAVFATSTLMFFYAFCTFSKLSDANADKQQDSDNTNDSLSIRTSRILGAEWIPLVRGIQAVIGPIYEHLKEGPLKSTLHLKDWDDMDPNMQPGLDDQHVVRIKQTWADDGNKAVYDETLYLLRKMSAWVLHFRKTWEDQQEEWGYNGSWSAPFVWLSLVPKEYFKLQQQRQPLALLIFAYFGALLEQLHTGWWTAGCGTSIVGVVDDFLGSYWAEWMEWPKQVVNQQQQRQTSENQSTVIP
ncbi:uncharacterized protein J4E92_001212 [Alternaria infectoria]|uniref:uncharacterized protein n=1 Tax=Alternaria infectoria TaxID=45303 RepID=UPI00221FF73B|nr:uncharacterized protein J4E92_001212 [Alternaria infectoria]KAI4939925.1 hypothetical protein J4E92_001212 [Alternaria infectoria]